MKRIEQITKKWWQTVEIDLEPESKLTAEEPVANN
jgi:hypothetical protein